MRRTNRTEKAKPDDPEAKPKSHRGFAAMDPEALRKLSSRGGKAAHEQGTAHEFTQEEAQAAGRKGGLASRRREAAK